MATPTEHRAAATAVLTRPTNQVRPDLTELAVADVHAILATKAGTGSDYTAAEALLTQFNQAPWSFELVGAARVHAHLAP